MTQIVNKFVSANVIIGAGAIYTSPRDTTPVTVSSLAAPVAPTSAAFTVTPADAAKLNVGDVVGLASATPTYLAAEASTSARITSITVTGTYTTIAVSPTMATAPGSANDVRQMWINRGATDGGIEFMIKKDITELYVDQALAPVAEADKMITVTLKCPLAEATLANLSLVAGGPNPTSTTILQGNSTDVGRTDRLLMVGKAPNSLNRWFVVHKAKSMGVVNHISKKDAKPLYVGEFKAFVDTTMTPDLYDILDA